MSKKEQNSQKTLVLEPQAQPRQRLNFTIVDIWAQKVLCCGTVLCIMGWITASLTSTHRGWYLPLLPCHSARTKTTCRHFHVSPLDIGTPERRSALGQLAMICSGASFETPLSEYGKKIAQEAAEKSFLLCAAGDVVVLYKPIRQCLLMSCHVSGRNS
jgi:hypothetical protein